MNSNIKCLVTGFFENTNIDKNFLLVETSRPGDLLYYDKIHKLNTEKGIPIGICICTAFDNKITKKPIFMSLYDIDESVEFGGYGINNNMNLPDLNKFDFNDLSHEYKNGYKLTKKLNDINSDKYLKMPINYTAADICYYYNPDDSNTANMWYLPSIYEWELLYNNNIIKLTLSYWTANQYDKNGAYVFNMSDGTIAVLNKKIKMPIRAFIMPF